MSDSDLPDPDLPNPVKIRRHVLRDGDVSVAILNLGCITQDWRVPLNGASVPVVLGYENPRDYLKHPNFMGAIVGRVANRISGAGFDSGGQRFDLSVNELPNHLHGGAGGLFSRIWEMQPAGPQKVDLHLVSQAGDQGYPGRVEFDVSITLSGYELRYDMRATTDQITPVNLAQHSYYSLASHGDILDHHLQIAADRFTPNGPGLIPTGQIQPLQSQEFDFATGQTLRAGDPGQTGLDMNFVLNNQAGQPAVRMNAPNGLGLSLFTDQPCLQLYTADNMRPASASTSVPLPGQTHTRFGGVCLEPQAFPNAPNVAAFPSIMIGPERPYSQSLRVVIAPGSKA